jgi:hypothetical protein
MALNMRERFLAAMGDTPPAPKPTIKTCNFSHDQIALWMIANPSGKLGDCAREFDYSQSWLSIIIHSDAFQARYEELRKQADASVIHDIPAKMRGVASLALDALADQIETAAADNTVAPRDFLLRTSDSLLTKLGYGAQKNITVHAPGENVKVTVVDSATLERARAKLQAQRQDEKEVQGETLGLPNPAS